MEKRALNLSRRKFTKEFKLAAVRRLEMGASVAEVARACEIDPNLLHRWRREFRDGVETAFPGLGRKRASEENRLAELERKIGQHAGDRFFKACLAESRGVADAASHKSRGAIYEQIIGEREKAEAG